MGLNAPKANGRAGRASRASWARMLAAGLAWLRLGPHRQTRARSVLRPLHNGPPTATHNTSGGVPFQFSSNFERDILLVSALGTFTADTTSDMVKLR